MITLSLFGLHLFLLCLGDLVYVDIVGDFFNVLQAKESDVGAVYRVAGPLVIAENMTGAAM